ncbi:uncharacterized protein LOC124366094 isoform X1 [Homalodisca vitripennis]|uniref:uncharacterized protein LOC124366094 isoform X1 n=1 Tax=Homalodisca vitripennis TaxID=197043 RepID=UPI001EEC9427|nr:uncharacterized protein LOC124366094 isoform X1 [Homalodisca vitripennis]
MSLMTASFAALVTALALVLALSTAYPTKDDEAYYYNRLHDLPDTYNKDVRNLDGIDSREEVQPLLALLAKVDQDASSERGSKSKYKFGSGSHLDGIGGGHLVRDLEMEQGGGNLLRDLDVLRNRAAFFSRGSRDPRNYRFDTLMGSTLGGVKRTAGGCCDSLSGIGLGGQKRNMDEIDRTGFNSFIKKNFDEIDRSGFGSFVKRNFDEIDRSGFGGFVKRSASPAAAEQVHN